MTIMTFVGKQPDKGNSLRCDNPQELCFPFSSGGGGVESAVPMGTRVEKSRSVKLLFRETYSVQHRKSGDLTSRINHAADSSK